MSNRQNPADEPIEPVGDEGREAYVRAVHDKGLGFDLATMSRRKMLFGIGGIGALAIVGVQSLSGVTSGATAAGVCVEEVPSETAGPYPGDGSNGIDVRTESGIVRKDITSSFGTSTTVAEGVPMTIELTVQDLDCAPIAGAAVYLWHCDRDGNYSLYSSGITDENYLRGIQTSDENGLVSFTSIFPACYLGRWPHIHFEVYSSLENATSGSGPIVKTSQIALPEDVSDTVYATADGYSRSVSNMTAVTLETDNVFGEDSAALQMATVTGSVDEGYTAALTISVDPSDTEGTSSRTASAATS